MRHIEDMLNVFLHSSEAREIEKEFGRKFDDSDYLWLVELVRNSANPVERKILQENLHENPPTSINAHNPVTHAASASGVTLCGTPAINSMIVQRSKATCLVCNPSASNVTRTTVLDSPNDVAGSLRRGQWRGIPGDPKAFAAGNRPQVSGSTQNVARNAPIELDPRNNDRRSAMERLITAWYVGLNASMRRSMRRVVGLRPAKVRRPTVDAIKATVRAPMRMERSRPAPLPDLAPVKLPSNARACLDCGSATIHACGRCRDCEWRIFRIGVETIR